MTGEPEPSQASLSLDLEGEGDGAAPAGEAGPSVRAGQTNLAATEPVPLDAPLAERLRPHSLEEVIGQQHLIGTGKPLRVAVDGGKTAFHAAVSPPGRGENHAGAHFGAKPSTPASCPFSAVFSGVKDIREAIEKAQIARCNKGRRIHFICR